MAQHRTIEMLTSQAHSPGGAVASLASTVQRLENVVAAVAVQQSGFVSMGEEDAKLLHEGVERVRILFAKVMQDLEMVTGAAVSGNAVAQQQVIAQQQIAQAQMFHNQQLNAQAQ